MSCNLLWMGGESKKKFCAHKNLATASNSPSFRLSNYPGPWSFSPRGMRRFFFSRSPERQTGMIRIIHLWSMHYVVWVVFICAVAFKSSECIWRPALKTGNRSLRSSSRFGTWTQERDPEPQYSNSCALNQMSSGKNPCSVTPGFYSTTKL